MKYTSILMLAAAVSLDSAAAGAALGSGGIRLPKLSALVISGAGALFLLIPALFGDIISGFIPADICRLISKSVLAVMGIAALIKYAAELRGKPPDGADADTNRDRYLSAGEAAVLAAGLSADSAVTGISAGLAGTDAFSASLLFFRSADNGIRRSRSGAFSRGKALGGK